MSGVTTRATARAKNAANVVHVLKTIGLESNQIDCIVRDNGVNRIDVLEGTSKEVLNQMMNESNGILKRGTIIALEKFARWCRWHRNKNNGKLPTEWEVAFDEDALFDFSASMEVKEIAVKSKGSSKSSLSDDEEREDMFRVKPSEFPDFDGRQNLWCNFRDKFEAVSEAAGIEDCLAVDFEDPTDHKARLASDTSCAIENRKLHKTLKKSTAQGAARGKVKKHDASKDGGKACACLRSCCDQDGDKQLHAQGILNKLIGLTLEHNSPGGMDGFICKFEEWCDELELAGQPLSEQQKHTFFPHGVKDKDCENIKDQCDGDDCQTAVLKLRKKAIKIHKASSSSGSDRRANQKQVQNPSNDNQQEAEGKEDFYLPPDVWAQLGTKEKQWMLEHRRKDKQPKDCGSQCEKNDNASESNDKSIADGKIPADGNENKNDENNDAKPSQKSGWKLASSMGGTRNQKMMTRTSTNKTKAPKDAIDNGAIELACVDSGSDTCGIGNKSWHVENETDRKVAIAGCDAKLIKKDVPIGTRITAMDLPDGSAILLRVEEAAILGEKSNTLFSEMQMEQNGVLLEKDEHGNRCLEADGHVLPIRIKHAMKTLAIRKPTENELRTLPKINLASDEPWDPATIHDACVDGHMGTVERAEILPRIQGSSEKFLSVDQDVDWNPAENSKATKALNEENMKYFENDSRNDKNLAGRESDIENYDGSRMEKFNTKRDVDVEHKHDGGTSCGNTDEKNANAIIGWAKLCGEKIAKTMNVHRQKFEKTFEAKCKFGNRVPQREAVPV